MNKYRYYNETASDYEIVLSDVIPTACLNGTDTFNTESITLVESNILVNDGTPVHQDATIGAYKQLRYNEIDGKTVAIIGLGFTYDGQTFSLSLPAQKNWDAIKTSKADFTFPLDIGTLDNNTYSLATGNVNAFWIAGRDAVKETLDSGRVLKTSVFNAADRAAVDAVVDTR